MDASDPQIKGGVILHFREFAKTLPPDDFKRITDRFSPGARELLERPTLVASSWIPEKTWWTFWDATKVAFPDRYPEIIRSYGRFFGSRDFKGVLSAFVRVTSVSIGLTIILKMWRHYHSHGEPRILEKKPGLFRYELDFPGYTLDFHSIVGMLEVYLETVHAKDGKVEATLVAPGKALFALSWTP